MAGTRWVQRELLEKNPNADLAVYGVWFNMLPSDSRDEWPAELLTDPRVQHFWDEEKVVGTWYGKEVTGNPVEWDAYFLYGSESRWEQKPSHMISWGRTIVSTRQRLERDLKKLLERQEKQ